MLGSDWRNGTETAALAVLCKAVGSHTESTRDSDL